MSDNAKLTAGPIRKHLIEQTAPMLLGIASIMSVGIIDAYFVGELGPEPLAAISFAFPVTIMLSSLGVGVIVGINSVVSRALGGGRWSEAQRLAVQGVVLAAMFGLIAGVTVFAFHGPLFALLGAGGETAALIGDYMRPYAIGYPFLLVSMGANGALRAQGLAGKSAMILGSMAAANWVLDPLLIAGWGPFPSYGIAGAAYASAGSFVLAGLVGLTFAMRSRLGLQWGRLSEGGLLGGLRRIGKVGGPAAISNSINPLGLTVLTGFLSSFGDEAVAAFGVAGRLQSMAVVPLLALSSTIGAIVGQNWGAGRPDRSRLALREATLFSLAYGLAVAALLVTFRQEAAGIFSDEQAVIDAIGAYLIIAAWGFAGYGALIVTNGALNAIGRAPTATLISAFRVLAIMIPVAWTARTMFAESGVFAGELTANLIGGAVAYRVGLRALAPDRCPDVPAARAQPAE